ncbi:MAG: T9SS type A sorting domain-containing protein [Bacteroidota bacterium]|nr:T9SS type A sorting domain-containing protein [Bacteroidota bacterium]
MKRLLLTILIASISLASYSQCTPLPYQDSLYNIWPDTIQNLPIVTQGSPYATTLTIKTPTTLIEAADGDSSQTVIDSVIFGFTINEYIGHWPVDSMELISLTGLPNGLTYGCDISSCMLPGDFLTCAFLTGTTNDPVGVYPIDILVNVYTHGDIQIPLLGPYPIETDLYSALGSYETLPGYKVVINGSSTGFALYNSNELILLESFPNPSHGNMYIQFNSPSVRNIEFFVTDIFGRIIYEDIFLSKEGLNTIELSEDFPSGMYLYTIKTYDKSLSKHMMVF